MKGLSVTSQKTGVQVAISLFYSAVSTAVLYQIGLVW
jgi:hypothetical protein